MNHLSEKTSNYEKEIKSLKEDISLLKSQESVKRDLNSMSNSLSLFDNSDQENKDREENSMVKKAKTIETNFNN